MYRSILALTTSVLALLSSVAEAGSISADVTPGPQKVRVHFEVPVRGSSTEFVCRSDLAP